MNKERLSTPYDYIDYPEDDNLEGNNMTEDLDATGKVLKYFRLRKYEYNSADEITQIFSKRLQDMKKYVDKEYFIASTEEQRKLRLYGLQELIFEFAVGGIEPEDLYLTVRDEYYDTGYTLRAVFEDADNRMAALYMEGAATRWRQYLEKYPKMPEIAGLSNRCLNTLWFFDSHCPFIKQEQLFDLRLRSNIDKMEVYLLGKENAEMIREVFLAMYKR